MTEKCNNFFLTVLTVPALFKISTQSLFSDSRQFLALNRYKSQKQVTYSQGSMAQGKRSHSETEEYGVRKEPEQSSTEIHQDKH